MGSERFEALFAEPETNWYAFAGNITLAKAKTRAQVSDNISSIYAGETIRVVEITLAPDGKFPVTPPWVGGTWGGRCGSTIWLDEPCFIADRNKVDNTDHNVYAWYMNSRNGSEHFDQERPTPGYRVKCEGVMRHLGPCEFNQGKYIHIEWNPYESTGYVPMELALEV